jgi:CHASE2 domain
VPSTLWPSSLTASPAGRPSRLPDSNRGFLRRFLWGLAIVVIVELLLNVFECTSYWDRLTRGPGDWYMGIYRGALIKSKGAMPLTFVDIDEDAFYNHSIDGSTNRTDLAKLIEWAAARHPAAIVVDLDLSFKADGDPEFQNYLSQYGAERPPLIFTRSLKRRPGQPSGAPLELSPSQAERNRSPAETSHVSYEVPTPSEDGSWDGAPIYFASAGFQRHGDGVVRSWYLAEPYWDGTGIKVIPSVELLVLAIIDGWSSAKCDDALDKVSWDNKRAGAANDRARKLLSEVSTAFRGTSDKAEPVLQRLHFQCHGFVELGTEGAEERILYTIPWPIPENPPMVLLGNPKTELIKHVTAESALQSLADRKPPEDKPPERRIVLIGGSNSFSRDMYTTPFGQMPGGMVVLNSINSLLQQGQLHELSWPRRFALGVAFGMLVWACVEWLRLGLAILFAIIIVSFFTWALAINLIRFGIWLDVCAPMLAIFFDGARESAKAVWDDVRESGLRALLAPRLRHRGQNQ